MHKKVAFQKYRFTGLKVAVAALMIAAGLHTGNIHAEDTGQETAVGQVTQHPTFDPAFAVNKMMNPTAEQLYAKSKVTAFLPTRLPDIGWQFIELHSQMQEDGYEIVGSTSSKPQVAADSLTIASDNASNKDSKALIQSSGTCSDATEGRSRREQASI